MNDTLNRDLNRTRAGQRIALVTGANKGIGLEIARQLARAGVLVILGVRDHDRASAAVEALSKQGLVVQSVRLDLGDEASIAAAAATIADEHGRLDILVNNAGVVDAADGPPSVASSASVRRIMETNFIGTLAVTQAMLGLMRRSPPRASSICPAPSARSRSMATRARPTIRRASSATTPPKQR